MITLKNGVFRRSFQKYGGKTPCSSLCHGIHSLCPVQVLDDAFLASNSIGGRFFMGGSKGLPGF